jgi:hypothetical protein
LGGEHGLSPDALHHVTASPQLRRDGVDWPVFCAAFREHERRRRLAELVGRRGGVSDTQLLPALCGGSGFGNYHVSVAEMPAGVRRLGLRPALTVAQA